MKVIYCVVVVILDIQCTFPPVSHVVMISMVEVRDPAQLVLKQVRTGTGATDSAPEDTQAAYAPRGQQLESQSSRRSGCVCHG